MPASGPVMTESLRDSTLGFASPRTLPRDHSNDLSNRSRKVARQSPGQGSAAPRTDSELPRRASSSDAAFQEAAEDLEGRASSLADSDYQDCASDASGVSAGSASWGDADDTWASRGAQKQASRNTDFATTDSQRPLSAQAQPDQHAWKAKLEDALQAKDKAKTAVAELQAKTTALQQKISTLEAQAERHAQETEAAAKASQRQEEQQEVMVARLVAGALGRVSGAHQASQAASNKVATLQMRLERMGRMEASMASSRRQTDDSASRRLTAAAIAVGASGAGALVAWLVVSRLQQAK